jgi:hypothetical protein
MDQNRVSMKSYLKQLKSTVGTRAVLRKEETRPAMLYVAYRNKAMIDAYITTGHSANGYNKNTRSYRASIFTGLESLFTTDGVPVILSHDDDMMLYDEEVSEYY